MSTKKVTAAVGRWLEIAALAISVAACGTAPKPLGRVNASVDGSLPERDLPITTRIVADERPAEFIGFRHTFAERQAFNDERGRRINSNANTDHTVSGLIGQGAFHPLAWPLLPLTVPVLVVTAITEGVVSVGKTSGQEITLHSESEGKRLATLVGTHANSASLAQRTAVLFRSEDSEYPRLEVRLTSAHIEYGRERTLRLIATAQAYPAAGVEWPATEHQAALAFLPGKVTERQIEAMRTALVNSIFATYMPSHAALEKEEWARADGDGSASAIWAYLDAHPHGLFASAAKKRLEKLEIKQLRAQRKAAKRPLSF